MPNIERFRSDFVKYREIGGQIGAPNTPGHYSNKAKALWDETVRNDNIVVSRDVLVVNQNSRDVDLEQVIKIVQDERQKFTNSFYNLIIPPSMTIFLGTKEFTHTRYKSYGDPPLDALALGGYTSCCFNVDNFNNNDLSVVSPERRAVIHEPGHCWWRWALGLQYSSTTTDEILAGPTALNEWEDVPNISFVQPPELDANFYEWYNQVKDPELNYFKQPAIKFALKYYSLKKPVAEYFSF